MNWLLYALLTSMSYGLYNFFVKVSAEKLSPSISYMLITGTAFLIAVLTTLYYKFTGQGLVYSKNEILFPILAGVFTGLAGILYLVMYSKNAPLSVGLPLIMGGTLLVGVCLGIILLKEDISTVKVIGILLSTAGLIILSRS